MTITLGPNQQKLIDAAMQTGAYRDPNDVIERALEMLHSEDEWSTEENDEISAKIERAWAQSERGGVYTAEESRANMAQRKAQWLQEHQQRP